MKFYTDITLHKGKIYHSGYDNGKKFVTKQGFEPTLAIQCNEETGYKSLMGNNLNPIKFNSIAEFNKYKKEYKDAIELHGNISPIYQFISEKYKKECVFNKKDIRIFFYDIETIDETQTHRGFPKPEDAPVPVVSIAIKDAKKNVMWLLSLKDYEPTYKQDKLISKKVIHKKCVSESHLLKSFVAIFKKLQPDLLIGYNNRLFDDPYILHRIEKICGFEVLRELSPLKQVYYSFEKDKYNKIKCKYDIKGLQILDYLELYKKFIPQGRESYTLSYISRFELGEDKVDYSEHENITEFYIQDSTEFLFYNIRDVELIELLDIKLKLLDLVFTIAYMAKINYEDVMSPIRTWDSIIFEHLKTQNKFIPPDKHEERVSYAGAYVHDPEPGIYDWVVSYDLNSLYPHVIMQWNISPETLIEEKIESVNQNEIDNRFLTKEIIPDENYILSGSGHYFSKTESGIFPYLMQQMYETRVEVKNEMKDTKQLRDDSLTDKITALNNKQLTLKILLNSLYGALASPYFRYFDVRLAKSITLSGQLAIKWISEKVNNDIVKKYNLSKDIYVYSDTDSSYFCLDFISESIKKKNDISTKKMVDVIDKFSKKIMEPTIEKFYLELKEYLNCNLQKMIMQQEKISEKYLSIAKKRYACLVWDDEGFRYDEPELKVTGIEIVRSSTPSAIKPFLKESLITLMKHPEDIDKYINDVKEKYYKLKPEEIAFPRSVSDVQQYRDINGNPKKGCPIGVRAGLMYNKYINDNNLNMNEIYDGEKIKFFYTLTPNCFYNQNVFGYINTIPDREKIVPYIDYNTQFKKSFLTIIEEIGKKVNIDVNIKKQTELEDLF